MNRESANRSGVILISVFLCLMAVVLVGSSLMRAAAIERRQLRNETRQTQAEWLLRSGLSRSLRRLKRDGTYPGETWNVNDRALDDVGRVRIDVTRVDALRRRVTVEARYPNHPIRRALKKKTWIIQLQSGDNS